MVSGLLLAERAPLEAFPLGAGRGHVDFQAVLALDFLAMDGAGHRTEDGTATALAGAAILGAELLDLAELHGQRLIGAGGGFMVVHGLFPVEFTADGAAVGFGLGRVVGHALALAVFLILVVVLAVALNDFGFHGRIGALARTQTETKDLGNPRCILFNYEDLWYY